MKKEFYEAPDMELLELALEAGFAASNTGGIDGMDTDDDFGGGR